MCPVPGSPRAKEKLPMKISDSRGPRRPSGPGHSSAGRQLGPGASRTTTAEEVAAVTYEHLATAIIEIEATEDNLVKSILIGYHQAAQRHLRPRPRRPGRQADSSRGGRDRDHQHRQRGRQANPGGPPAAQEGRPHPQHRRGDQGRLHVHQQQGEEGAPRPRPEGRAAWEPMPPPTTSAPCTTSSPTSFAKAIAAE